LNLGAPTPAMKASVQVASGSEETESYSPREVSIISEAIKARGITVVDVILALDKRGFAEEAENLLNVVKLRVSGDYLQTSAVVRDGKVISAVNDPNDYTGPGTGYRLGEKRRAEINHIRDLLDRESVLRDQNRHAKSEARRIVYRDMGPADIGNDPTEVVIGISPAFGLKLFQTTAGHSLAQVLKEMTAGIKAKGGKPRIVRFRHTADTSFLGLSAAGVAGSGIGIGIQAKGTAVIHQRGRLPHNNLELFSNAPITTLEHYRRLGENAATYAKSEIPDPVVVPTKGQAMGARFHAQTALIYAIETSLTEEGAKPENVEIKLLDGAA
jgi:propanediol dehydratase large subunit